MKAIVRYCVKLVRRNNAEELSGPRPSLPAARRNVPQAVAPVAVVADLPRCCAVHNRPYIARYLAPGPNARFRLAQTFALTQRVYRNQYAGNDNMRTVPASDIEPEECGCCGACTPDGFVGAVPCWRCGVYVCWGLTVEKQFRCGCCGATGTVQKTKSNDQAGLAPSWQR